jgi:peptidyl-prolyl cis-trans isomerase D
MVLDLMRREKKKVLGLFLIPLIFGLVAYLIPGFSGGSWGGGLNQSVLAKVGRKEISNAEFSAAYSRFLRNNRIPFDRQYLKALRFDQQILNQLISQELIISEGRRLGLDATPSDIQQKILSFPFFQDNGAFVMVRYEAILRNQGMTPTDFENEIRQEIVRTRLHGLLTDGVTISETEAEKEYQKRNEKVKVDYVVFDPASLTSSVAVDENELKNFFNSSRENYRMPEQRKAQCLYVNSSKLMATVQVTDAELNNYYQQNLSTYQLPERVRASHILFKTEGKSPEETAKIKAKAMEVLQQVKGGADFAALAKKYSEDTSASNGGDLGFFGRGQMVPPFEKSAFTLGVGAISDLVTTQYGFHIIKVVERQSPRTQPLAEVANLIRPTLQQRKADQIAQDLADKAFSRTRTNTSFEAIARELKIDLIDTPLFAQGNDVPIIGNTPDFSNKLFAMKANEIGSPVRVPGGYVIPKMTGTKAPYVPELNEARAKAEQDYKSKKSVEVAKNKAQELVNKVKSGAAFEAAAKAMGGTVKTSDPIARNGNIQNLGATSSIDSFAFSGNVGDVSPVIAMGQKQAVFQLKEKFPIKPEDFAKEKDSLRETLASQQKDQVFQAYLDEVKNRMIKAGKLKVNQKAFDDISRRL